MDTKKRLVISYKNCSEEILEAIRQQYPKGYNDALIKIDKPNGDSFYAITVETEEAHFLVKVDVKIDTISPEDLEKELNGGGLDTDEDRTDDFSEDADSIGTTEGQDEFEE